MGKVMPVIIEALSLKSEMMGPTTSSVSANLPIGILSNIGLATTGSDLV